VAFGQRAVSGDALSLSLEMSCNSRHLCGATRLPGFMLDSRLCGQQRPRPHSVDNGDWAYGSVFTHLQFGGVVCLVDTFCI
jgi:hypothetical protein